MSQSLQLPQWSLWVLALALIAFVAMCVLYIRKNRGIRRPVFAMPYTLWMILFTIVPCLLVAYYAFRDPSTGQFTFDHFLNFWDSNYTVNQMYEAMGPEYEVLITHGTVNVDVLVYSLWMALLCTVICFFLGYPAALFMADREMTIGSTIVVLFIIPMWMNFLLRTIAWMSLLEDQGLINQLLTFLGFDSVKLMYNNSAVLLGMVYNFLPFMVFPIYSTLNKMDTKLLEAAQDLGANNMRTFLRVTFPLSIPGIISGITMVFMPSVTTFFIPRILGGGHTMMFGDLIESMFLTANDWGVGSALSLIMVVLILISLGILRKADPDGEGGGMA